MATRRCGSLFSGVLGLNDRLLLFLFPPTSRHREESGGSGARADGGANITVDGWGLCDTDSHGSMAQTKINARCTGEKSLV